MTKLTTIEIHKEDMKFSAGHYTIFSPTHREKLHGHNFNVFASITAELNEFGMAFDYDIYKQKLRDLCAELDGIFLIAGQSKHQTIEEEGDYLYVHFHTEKIPFLKDDVLLVPMSNITVEELSLWFVNRLTEDKDFLAEHGVQEIIVKVYSGPGQAGKAAWHP